MSPIVDGKPQRIDTSVVSAYLQRRMYDAVNGSDLRKVIDIDIDLHTGGGPIWPSHRLWRDDPEQRAYNESCPPNE